LKSDKWENLETAYKQKKIGLTQLYKYTMFKKTFTYIVVYIFQNNARIKPKMLL